MIRVASATGTTRGQMTRLLLREAALLGGVGTVLGMGAGVFLARGLLGMQEQLLGVKLPPLQLTAEPLFQWTPGIGWTHKYACMRAAPLMTRRA